MVRADPAEVTHALRAAQAGDDAAADRLISLVYEDLRRLAARYLSGSPRSHTLQPTALVNEAFVKLVKQDQDDFGGRSHFFAVGAKAMRHILVDYARAHHAKKRGGGKMPISLDERLTVAIGREEDILAVDEALEKLAELDERQAKIVELRFFGGLTVAEVAHTLGLSKRTIESEWTMAKAWLRSELTPH